MFQGLKPVSGFKFNFVEGCAVQWLALFEGLGLAGSKAHRLEAITCRTLLRFGC
jgi:hypothetical protein